MRAGGSAWGRHDRSGNCSSLTTANATGSSYQRTGLNRTEGADDLGRVLPLGGMPPSGRAVAPTSVGNQAKEYHDWKIQGRGVPTAPLREITPCNGKT